MTIRVNVPATGTTSTTSPLVGIGLANRRDLQGIHTNLGVVHPEFGVSGVNNIQDAIHCSVLSVSMELNDIYAPCVPVRDVSAMLVATMTLRRPSAVGSKILACRSAGICE